MSLASAYIVAARRTALGRIGGLHRNRRIPDISVPIISAALKDAGLEAGQVDELILGNTSEGGNPARLIALSAGIPETAAACSIDRQCASGLDAVLAAIRTIGCGEADVIVAGGAEAISTAPWRIAKPKSLYQLPHFMAIEPGGGELGDVLPRVADEALPRLFRISRERQDNLTFNAHLKAESAHASKRFVGEIVPLRANAEEARDESAVEPALRDLERLRPFEPPNGTLTPGNTSALHDGAAFAVLVNENVWTALGKPPALRLVASAVRGVTPENEGIAPIEAMRKLYARLDGYNRDYIGVVEMSESSAAQVIALSEALGIDLDRINPRGGAVVRGHPLGAAGAVLIARLFSELIRSEAPLRAGAVALGTLGGMGVAAVFEAVRA